MKIKIVRHIVSLCCAAIVVLLLTDCNPTRKREAVWIDKDTCGKCGDLLSGYFGLDTETHDLHF